MRPLLYIFSAFLVMGLAFWAYRENYTTHRALHELAAVQDQIASLREDIAMQKVEWAYENRPSRLSELAKVNFPRLQLLPMEPWQLSDGKAVAYPPAPLPAMVDAGAAAGLDLRSAQNLAGTTGSGAEGKAVP